MKIFLILNNNSINILKRLYSNYNKKYNIDASNNNTKLL